MPLANQPLMVTGAVIVVSVAAAAAVAISQTPFGQDVRRKVALALHHLGDEINPNRPQQPRFNRPEDAEGFMEPHGGEMDADEESRRRQREELMYWNAIKLENLEKQKAKESQSKAGPTFDDILRKHSAEEDETYATKTGAEIQSEGLLRRRGEGSRGMERGSLCANPFADENYLDSDGDAKMIAPEEDEIDDIYTDNDLRDVKKPALDSRVLAAATDYPSGEHFTMQLENLSGHTVEINGDKSTVGDHSHPDENNSFMHNYMLGLEQENRERLTTANLTYPELPSTSNITTEKQPSFEIRSPQSAYRPVPSSYSYQSSYGGYRAAAEQSSYAPVTPPYKNPNPLNPQEIHNTKGHHALQDYQMQLMLLEQQNKKRLMMARQQQDDLLQEAQVTQREEQPSLITPQTTGSENRSTTNMGNSQGINSLQDQHIELGQLNNQRYLRSEDKFTSNVSSEGHEQLVDISEPCSLPKLQTSHESTVESTSSAYHTPEAESHVANDAFASIHAWADNSNASFYSPLPGTSRAPSSVAPSEPEHISGGVITPTDTLSLAGSGEDVGNDNASSVDGGRYDDVMSVDDGISTPGTWTEVGSVVSDDDSNHA